MILYKKDTKGKLRYLEIATDGDKVIRTSGIVGTDKPKVEIKSCKGKNIGRSNETTPEEQAKKEAHSLVTEKLQEGYFDNQYEARTIETLFPMLAKDYKKESKKIDWSKPVYVQPKLDGMRCLITIDRGKVTLMSREGRMITTMKHIAKDLANVSSGIYDGELYAHGFSFQENMKLIKKWVDGPNGSVQVKFHCYDVVLDKPFKIRLIERSNLEFKKTVEMVKTIAISNESELKKHHATFLDMGYEGSIVRHGDAPYGINARSSSLLKYKDFEDIALPILDIIPCKVRTNWGEPVFHWKGARGHRLGDDVLGANMKYSHEDRIDFLANKDKYIGKIAEVRYFELSDTGIPRFPVMVGIRLDKTKGDE